MPLMEKRTCRGAMRTVNSSLLRADLATSPNQVTILPLFLSQNRDIHYPLCFIP
jgi:hypothetical protein